MLRTPSAWAPSSSDSSAMRFRSRVVQWTRHSTSTSCWIPKATAIAPIRTLAIAESDTLTTSVPASRRSRAASSVRSMRMLRGGSISTEITNRRSASAAARRVGGWRSASAADVSTIGARGVAIAGIASRAAARACALRVSVPVTAARPAAIAATCSGVVPQQPPTMRAPASSSRGTMDAKYGGSAAYTNWPSSRWGRPAFGMIERAGPSSDPGPSCARASMHARGPTPQLTPIASTPAAVSASRATAGVVPSASTRSSPNVIDAITGRSEARRASSTASSRWPRSKNVSMTNRSTPPSSRPSICSRNAPRIAASSGWRSSRVGGPSGPMLPPTQASRPLTSRASRATWAARRLRRPASWAMP